MTAFAIPMVGDVERINGAAKNTQVPGMLLGDWFAGQIFAAMLGSDPSNSSQRDDNGQPCRMDRTKLTNMAKSAYQAADALIQVRTAGPSER